MSKRIAVVHSEDPFVTLAPVKHFVLRWGFLLGHEMTSPPGRRAPSLDAGYGKIVDVDILEKYLPSFKQLSIPFIVEPGTVMGCLVDIFSVTTRTADDRQLVQSATEDLFFKRSMIFL